MVFQALDEEYRNRKGGKGGPTRQYRARTPPPTARMVATGRLQRPKEDNDWRGSQRRVNHTPSRSVERAAKGGEKGKAHRRWQTTAPPETQVATETQAAETSEDELVPDTHQEKRAEIPELDEDSDGNLVPTFLFDESP